MERRGWARGVGRGRGECLVSMSPLDKADKMQGLGRAFNRTGRTDNRKGIAAVNLAAEGVP